MEEYSLVRNGFGLCVWKAFVIDANSRSIIEFGMDTMVFIVCFV